MDRTAPKGKFIKRIGELLVDKEVITGAQLNEALERQRETGGKIVEVLIAMGCLRPADFTRFLARMGIPAVDLCQFEIPEDFIRLIPAELAHKHEVVPIDMLGSRLTVAMACPLDRAALEDITATTGKQVKPVLCAAGDVRAALDRYYGKGGEPHAEADLASFGMKPTAAKTAPEAASAPASTRELEAPLRLEGVANLIRKLNALPTLPDTVQRVQEIADSQSGGAREIADVLSKDPPLAAKILSVVNSPAYGLPEKVHDIALAVSMLGMEETCSIVFSAGVIDIMFRDNAANYKEFWGRALRCARIAKLIAVQLGSRKAEGVFAAALLHDIGRLALRNVAASHYEDFPPDLFGEALLAEEEQRIGITHTEAGHVLAENWHLPEVIQQSIRHYTDPWRAEAHQKVVAVVAVADVLANADRILARDCAKALGLLGADSKLVLSVLQIGLSRFDLEDALIP